MPPRISHVLALALLAAAVCQAYFSTQPHLGRFAAAARRTAVAARPTAAWPTAAVAAVYQGEYAAELEATARALVAPGKGLLACDESTGTAGKRLASIGLDNTAENRARWRELLLSTPGLSDHVSGAILAEETLYQAGPRSGRPLVELLRDNQHHHDHHHRQQKQEHDGDKAAAAAGPGMLAGVKVDRGLAPLLSAAGPSAGQPQPGGETWVKGLDDLLERCQAHYAAGARFAKWRAALQVDVARGLPSALAVHEAARGLAAYARTCQEAGLVPIVEPEVLMQGGHTADEAAAVQEQVLSATYAALRHHGVRLEGSLLKPSMVVPGVDCPRQGGGEGPPAKAREAAAAAAKVVAALTLRTLRRCVPAAVPGVCFLSGGLSEEDASVYLNEINRAAKAAAAEAAAAEGGGAGGGAPWALTFSFSRALQASCLKVWGGDDAALLAAQAQLLARARANGEASRGAYEPGSQPSDQASLFVKDYVY